MNLSLRPFLRKFRLFRWLYETTAPLRNLIGNLPAEIRGMHAIRRFKVQYIPRKNNLSVDAPFLSRSSLINDELVFRQLRNTFFTEQDTRAGWIGAGIPKTDLPEGQDLAKMASEHLAMYVSCLPFMEAANNTQFSLLDVGCGFGSVTRCLATTWPNSSIVGIDYDKIAIRFAKKTNSEKNISFIATDFLKYRTATKFKYIFLVDVLEHIPNKLHNTFIDKCLDLLSPNGKFFLITPNAVHEEDGDHSHIGLLNAERMPLFIERYSKYFEDEAYIIDDQLKTMDPNQFIVSDKLEYFEKYQNPNQRNYSSHIRVIMTR